MSVVVSVEGVEIHDAVDNAIIRAELHLAIDAVHSVRDDTRKAYLTGVYLGYSVAMGMLDVEILDTARREPFTGCLRLDEALAPIRQAHEGGPRLAACGVRWGYKQATRFETEADECARCGERLMPSDEIDWCHRDQQAFCGFSDCLDVWHSGRCSECDQP